MRAAFAAGDLKGAEGVGMTAHVATCEACQAEIAAYIRLRQVTRAIGLQEQTAGSAPESLVSGILSRLPPAAEKSDD